MKKATQAQMKFVNKVFTNLVGIETFEEEGFMKEETRVIDTYHLKEGVIDIAKFILHTDYIKRGSVKIAQVWHGQRPMTLVVYGKKAFLVRRNVFIKLNGLAVKIPNYHGELISATIA